LAFIQIGMKLHITLRGRKVWNLWTFESGEYR